ncbi:MAG: hypothetical protein Q8L66_12850 [Caulobacter sp.]|nr:hypothetical protein [Caulobacter sp.]
MRSLITVVIVAALLAGPASAQVEVQTLAAPDYFSLGDRDTGLPTDLWRGTSPSIAREIIPQLDGKPITPAATDLARRILRAGVAGPGEAGRDPDLAAARVRALLSMGEAHIAWTAVERAPGVSTNGALAAAAAEAALIAGQDDTACRISDQLSVDRADIYWLRLRAYCEAIAGQRGKAHLTLSLANDRDRDPVYARLMAGVLGGAAAPDPASLRNGLEMAMSRRLALDPEPARSTAAPAIARMLWSELPPLESEDQVVAHSMIIASLGTTGIIDSLLDEAAAAPSRARPDMVGRILLLEAMGGALSPEARARLTHVDLGKSTASPGLLMGLDRAAALGLKGETALLALAIALEAGTKGPAALDRARIVAALRKVGLDIDARAIAIEGLAGGR